MVEGTSGNISARMEDGNIACTPSSLDYRIMAVDDIVIVNPAGDVVSGERGPTSEKYLHLAVMNAYEDIGRLHPLARRATPPCSPWPSRTSRAASTSSPSTWAATSAAPQYAPSGSPDLAEQVVKALEDRGAALIANHGMVAVGTTMEKTMHNTALVERSAKIIWGAKQLGTIYPLPEKVNANFANVYPYMR